MRKSRLRLLRLSAGLSENEIAEKADISREMIAMIELGHRNPSERVAQRIAAALGVEVEDLFPSLEE